jgi:hypothetical protein
VQEHLDKLMREEGTIGYCLINFDGKLMISNVQAYPSNTSPNDLTTRKMTIVPSNMRL